MLPDPEIQIVTSLHAIRQRPSMFVQADKTGSISDHLLRSALCHPLSELVCGSTSFVTISIRGQAAKIEDEGEGWPVHDEQTGRRYAELMLSEMWACHGFKQHAAIAHRLCDVSLPVVVALSTSFVLETRHNGTLWRQSLANGIIQEPLHSIGAATTTGTSLEFTLDPVLCGESAFSSESLALWLRTLEPDFPTQGVKIIEL